MAFIGPFYYVGKFVTNEDYPEWAVLEKPRNYGITPAISAALGIEDIEQAAARAGMWSIGDRDFLEALKSWGVYYYPEGFVQFRKSAEECKRLAASLLARSGLHLLDSNGQFAAWRRVFGEESS
jgi:hypothetical protein